MKKETMNWIIVKLLYLHFIWNLDLCRATTENLFSHNHNNNFINTNQSESSLIAVKSTIYDDLDLDYSADDGIVIDAAAAVAGSPPLSSQPSSPSIDFVDDVREFRSNSNNNKNNDNTEELVTSRRRGGADFSIRSNDTKSNADYAINNLTDDDRLILSENHHKKLSTQKRRNKKVRKRKGNRKKHKRFKNKNNNSTATVQHSNFADDKLLDEHLKENSPFSPHYPSEMNNDPDADVDDIDANANTNASRNKKNVRRNFHVNDNDNVTSNEDKTIQIIVENDENELKFNRNRNGNDVITTNGNDNDDSSSAALVVGTNGSGNRNNDDADNVEDEHERLRLVEKAARKRQRQVFHEQQLHEKLLRRKRKRKLDVNLDEMRISPASSSSPSSSSSSSAATGTSLSSSSSSSSPSGGASMGEHDVKQNTTTVTMENKWIGDLSCMKHNFKPAPDVLNADIKYLRNDMYGIDNSFLEAEYHCRKGYRLKKRIGSNSKNTNKDKNSNYNKSSTNLICKNGKWIGRRPICIVEKDKLWKNRMKNNFKCSKTTKCNQSCLLINGNEMCTCYKGFRLVNNRCVDINECVEVENTCEFGCSNTIGGFRCKCPHGLRINDQNKCIDINECLLRNGHGPCQDKCTNTFGSYKCSCDNLSGTTLSDDGQSCEDMDQCRINNGGCSHTCLNTLGRVFCVCPDGWMLDDDWKTCIDVNECSEDMIAMKPELKCNYGCINTIGSFKCITDVGAADQPLLDDDVTNVDGIIDNFDSDGGEDDDNNDVAAIESVNFSGDIESAIEVKSRNGESLEEDTQICVNGFFYNETISDCQDINECGYENGGCAHQCTNIEGSFYCSCRNGFIFGDDKHTCTEIKNSKLDTACPPLFPPQHGYLECSRPIDEDKKVHHIINRPGSQCVLICPHGFQIVGNFLRVCNEMGQWTGQDDGTCIRYPEPKLVCPPDLTVETLPNQTSVIVKIPKPKTDVNFSKDITAFPKWAKYIENSIKIGKQNVTYTARHPISKLEISCSFMIYVLEGKPPVIEYCPETQRYTIDKYHEHTKIVWSEPRFTDNVNVTEIIKTNTPGNYFGLGSHQIIYEARDAAGFSRKCIFKVIVNATKRKGIQYFQLPILYNKFNYNFK